MKTLQMPITPLRRAVMTLMHRGKIPWSAKVGPEERLCIEIADELRGLTLEGRLGCIWTHIPNEGKRHPLVALILRAMGMITGAADFVFTWPTGACWVEIKAGKGKQSEYQQYFEQWCGGQSVRYAVCRSKDEVLDLLKGMGALT